MKTTTISLSLLAELRVGPQLVSLYGAVCDEWSGVECVVLCCVVLCCGVVCSGVLWCAVM